MFDFDARQVGCDIEFGDPGYQNGTPSIDWTRRRHIYPTTSVRLRNRYAATYRSSSDMCKKIRSKQRRRVMGTRIRRFNGTKTKDIFPKSELSPDELLEFLPSFRMRMRSAEMQRSIYQTSVFMGPMPLTSVTCRQ